eukprot:jgi/Ulvmu1/11548/UM078_0039.1
MDSELATCGIPRPRRLEKHSGMSATLLCTLLVLAAPAAHALGLAAERGPGAASKVAARVQPAGGAGVLPLPISRGSTRELLTRDLRSRTPKSRVRRERQERTARKPGEGRRSRGTSNASSKNSSGGGSSKGKSKGKSKTPSNKSGKKSSRKVKSVDDDESLCAKHVVEKEIVRTKSAKAHVVAIEEAFAQACLEGSNVKMEIFQEVFMTADAFAFSQTISKAIITCKSDDEDAYECASVTATAEAYGRATAQAHAEAVAAAVNSCGCMSDAVSESISSESVYIKLVAEAASTATAHACIEGKGRVRASAYDKCSSKVFGRVFARAVSEAIVKGSCMNAEAISRVLTEASAKFDTESTCGLTAAAIAVE